MTSIQANNPQVSKKSLQFYVDEVDASLRFTNVGWAPPNANSVGFHHMGTKPLRTITRTAYLTWPTTYGLAFEGT